jgi:hypothetical protein
MLIDATLVVRSAGPGKHYCCLDSPYSANVSLLILDFHQVPLGLFYMHLEVIMGCAHLLFMRWYPYYNYFQDRAILHSHRAYSTYPILVAPQVLSQARDTSCSDPHSLL